MNQREAFEEWFIGEQGTPYDGMYSFALAAWKAAQQAQWHPIETAPRDGSPILVNWYGSASDSAVIVYWSNGWETGDSRQYEELQPDVWMPLPPEPKP